MILNFDEIKKGRCFTRRRKGANLGEMTSANINVPEWICYYIGWL